MASSVRLVVVTGAASGMGRACVDAVRHVADLVVAVDLTAPDIGGAVGLACDVSDAPSVTALVAEIAGRGKLRALVHAAGISPTMGDARRIFEVNLVGTELLLRGFEDLVVPGTAAVCFSSSAAYLPPGVLDDGVVAQLDQPLAPAFLDRISSAVPDSGFAYALSKVGVIRAAARAAARWGREGGRVNSLSPGLIDTPMGRRELEHQPVMQTMLEYRPPGRLGTSEEVATVCAFLVSDRSAFVSGIDVLVDGGLHAAMQVSDPGGPTGSQ